MWCCQKSRVGVDLTIDWLKIGEETMTIGAECWWCYLWRTEFGEFTICSDPRAPALAFKADKGRNTGNPVTKKLRATSYPPSIPG